MSAVMFDTDSERAVAVVVELARRISTSERGR